MRWVHFYFDDDAVDYYLEVDDLHVITRSVQDERGRVVEASSLAEERQAWREGGLHAAQEHWARFGGGLGAGADHNFPDPWDQPWPLHEMTEEQFDNVWRDARQRVQPFWSQPS